MARPTKILFCNKHGMNDFYLKGIVKERWQCKQCESVYSKKYLISLKEKAVQYKGGGCVKCGYNKCLRSLDFHHRDPKEKDFTIGENRAGKKIVRVWSKLQEELDKCDLLCRNCHGEVHFEIDNNKLLAETFDYTLDRVDVSYINNAIIKGRLTPEEALIKIKNSLVIKFYPVTLSPSSHNQNWSQETNNTHCHTGCNHST